MGFNKTVDYPTNILKYLELDGVDPYAPTEDQLAGLEYAISQISKARSRDMLMLRFKDGLTLKEIADQYNLSTDRPRRIILKAILEIYHNKRYIIEGLDGARLADEVANQNVEIKLMALPNIRLTDLGLSVRAYNAMYNAGARNLRDVVRLVYYTNEKPWYKNIQCCGPKTADEIAYMLRYDHGIRNPAYDKL